MRTCFACACADMIQAGQISGARGGGGGGGHVTKENKMRQECAESEAEGPEAVLGGGGGGVGRRVLWHEFTVAFCAH